MPMDFEFIPDIRSLSVIFDFISSGTLIFWRGYVQKTLQAKWSPNVGFAVTTAIYALVHLGSCNFMLVMAALVAGLAWGLLYRLFPQKFFAIILSHALWDVAVFVWFPI